MMSNLPCWSITSRTVRRQSSSDPMSPRCTVAWHSGKSSDTPEQNVSAASLLSLYPAAISAPWEARLREMAAPIPRVPPVTKATRPTSFSPARLVRTCVAVTVPPRQCSPACAPEQALLGTAAPVSVRHEHPAAPCARQTQEMPGFDAAAAGVCTWNVSPLGHRVEHPRRLDGVLGCQEDAAVRYSQSGPCAQPGETNRGVSSERAP